MEITIFILSILLYIGGLVRSVENNISNLASSALLTLTCWQINQTFGIVILCITGFLCLILIINAFINRS